MSVAVFSLFTFRCSLTFFFFFFNDTATTEIYTLSLHDALPILRESVRFAGHASRHEGHVEDVDIDTYVNGSVGRQGDRKSTRLNSSHGYISYAVFCLKKKKKKKKKFRPIIIK